MRVSKMACEGGSHAREEAMAGKTRTAMRRGLPRAAASRGAVALLVALGTAASLDGCAKSKPKAYVIPDESRDIFAKRCAACHGETGRGDGPAAANLNPKPRDYTNAAWQASVTDDQLRSIIVSGGFAVGKSPLMPPNPDLESSPAVVEGLVGIVRSFGPK
jgi:cytochrome c553